MAATDRIVMGVGAAVLVYIGFVVALAVTGRKADVRGLAGVVAACITLVRRLIADARVPRGHKLALVAALAYLVLPVDIVPDFLPVIGYLDDALVVGLALRLVLRSVDRGVIAEMWEGPDAGLRALLRVTEISLWPGIGAFTRTLGAGVLGLSVCVWVDIADNCAAGLSCREDDPMLLAAGRGIAVALCLAGLLGLMARVVDARSER